MLVKHIENKGKTDQNIRLSVLTAVLVFLLQVFCYQYYFGINSHMLYSLFEKMINFTFLLHLCETLPVNDFKNIALLLYLVVNGLLTMAVIWLIYTNARISCLSLCFILLGIFLYITCNVLHKATGRLEMSVLSIDILNFFSSPLITLFLIPTFKFYNQ